MRRRGRDARGEALLPGYVDLQEIGGGAFATVFKAVESETGRPVALKILRVDFIHSHLIETFQREIRALAAISDHPHIVTLYRPATTTDGRPVLVLELCRDSMARRLHASGRLTALEATDVGIKLAGALETAHRHGFLHRDMKPQNVLVTQFGQPALGDFGVAALQASAQMAAGVFSLTTLHAAPEMLEGHHLSPATDVYGLASTMYEMLTGAPPFAAYDHEAPASVILRILRDPVRPMRHEEIPLPLADLVESALAKEPQGRPRSAAQFALGLQAVQAEQGWPETAFVAWGEQTPEARPGRTERSPRAVVVPPLLPPSRAVTGQAAPVGGGSQERSEPPAGGDPGGDPGGAGSANTADTAGSPGPSGSLGPRRPSVAQPGPAQRNVVQPREISGGHPRPFPPSGPLASPGPEPLGRAVTPAQDRPRQEGGSLSGPSRSLYDEDGSGADGAGHGGAGPSPMYAAWSVAAVVVAVLVIIAAALVVAGVI